MSRLRIINIGELAVVPRGPVRGRAMRDVPRIANASLDIVDGRIAWFGPASRLSAERGRELFAPHETFDARGCCVVPGLVDCHTHTVFAGSREHEFVQRIEGRSYTEIAERGGGIRVTVDAVRKSSLEELVALALPRLRRMLANGVTACEIKSGYGLSVADELKMLRAVVALRDAVPMELVGTYLAAHTTPREFAGRPEDYLDVVLDDAVLQQIRDERLAEFCDVFCERTAFDIIQSRRVLETGKRFGFGLKLHADQISQMGATRLAGEVRAVSADHLEHIDDGGIEALRAAGSIAVLLPSCSFFLGVPQAPSRRLLEADLPVAVATDYNPGSSMVEALPLTMSIACMQMRMTPAEALVASTANAAAALRREDRLGAIAVGHQADLVVLDVPNVERWMYEPGRNCVRAVILNGQIVHQRKTD